jgi:hypothetical protein
MVMKFTGNEENGIINKDLRDISFNKNRINFYVLNFFNLIYQVRVKNEKIRLVNATSVV